MQKIDLKAIESISSLRRVSLPEQSISSSLRPTLKKKRSRRFSQLHLPQVISQKTEPIFHVSKKPEVDRFLEMMNKDERDSTAAKLIYRKIFSYFFFQENKHLFEEKLDLEASIYLCQKMTLETVKENEIIYERDEETNGKIYLIYKGEIGTFTSKESDVCDYGFENGSISAGPATDIWNRRIIPQLKRQASILSQLDEKEEDDSSINDILETAPSMDKSRRKMNPHCGLVVSKILTNEEYFGKEVLNDLNIREDTVVAKTETYLLVIKEEDLKYVKYRYEKDRTRKLNFLIERLSLSNELEHKNHFFNHLTEKTLSFGQVFLTEGSPGKHVYFICKGRCEIQKRSKENPTGVPSAITSSHFRRDFTIGVAEEGDFVGEEILFDENLKYNYTVRVAAPKALFFVIEASALLKILNKDTISKIKETHSQKAQNYKLTYRSISTEFNKMDIKAFMTSSKKSRGSICGNSETPMVQTETLKCREMDDKVKASIKPRFSLQISADVPLSSSVEINCTQRNFLKSFYSRGAVGKIQKEDIESHPNTQPKAYGMISTDDFEKEPNANNKCISTRSYFTETVDTLIDAPSTVLSTSRKTFIKVDKPVKTEPENTNSFAQLSPRHKLSKNLNVESSEDNLHSFLHPILEDYFGTGKKATNKVMSSRNPKTNKLKLKTLKNEIKKPIVLCDEKVQSIYKNALLDSKGVGSLRVKTISNLRKLCSHTLNPDIISRNTDR